MTGCPLCQPVAARLLWQGPRCRVELAGEADDPGFCRVIWQDHVREMTDLAPAEQLEYLGVVLRVEAVLRELLAPDKVNLASLGNVVPHLHWHVIPRHADDAHFPDAVWAPRRRAGVPRAVDRAALERRERGARGREIGGVARCKRERPV